MPRKKVTDHIRLSARISTNNASQAKIDFVRDKLNEGMSKAVLVRQAISIYKKWYNGNLSASQVQDDDQQNNDINRSRAKDKDLDQTQENNESRGQQLHEEETDNSIMGCIDSSPF